MNTTTFFSFSRIAAFFFVLAGVMIVVGLKKKYPEKFSFLTSSSSSSTGAGGTPTLNSYGTDFTAQARIGKTDPVIGRMQEVARLTQVLTRRSKNNAILVGPPGVGKTAIVEALAQRIAKNEVPEVLRNKRVLGLDVATLLAGTKYRGEFEQRAKKIVQEISNANRSVILFIDEVHAVIQSHGTEGAVNFADILKPALARGDLQMIGATTIEEYNTYIKSDPSLERRFQPIEVHEPTEEETLGILQGVKEKYATYHKVEFTDAALETAVRLTKEKIRSRRLPDKAIDAIDEAAAMVKVSHVDVAIPALLYQAAVTKYPEIADLWRRIQMLDRKSVTDVDEKEKAQAVKDREAAEAELQKRGVAIVDSGDVEKVVDEWTEMRDESES